MFPEPLGWAKRAFHTIWGILNESLLQSPLLKAQRGIDYKHFASFQFLHRTKLNSPGNTFSTHTKTKQQKGQEKNQQFKQMHDICWHC
jgi:hypothetical protein